MKAGTQWTTEEDDVIRTCYPTLGNERTARRLKEMGYDRTSGAVKARASNLGVRKVLRVEPENKWTDEEVSVLMSVYPTMGADATTAELARRGYSRSPQSVRVRATMLGIKSTVKRRGSGDNYQCNFVLDRNLDTALIRKLDSVRNRSEYIRGLIRRDIRDGQKNRQI